MMIHKVKGAEKAGLAHPSHYIAHKTIEPLMEAHRVEQELMEVGGISGVAMANKRATEWPWSPKRRFVIDHLFENAYAYYPLALNGQTDEVTSYLKDCYLHGKTNVDKQIKDQNDPSLMFKLLPQWRTNEIPQTIVELIANDIE